MITLTPQSQEPFWLEILPGQRTQFRPITVAMILAARSHGSVEAIKANDAAGGVASEAFTKSICKGGIVAWEGVQGPDGKDAPVTPENIDAYLSNWRVFDEIDRRYVLPVLRQDAEKNASAPSRSGTSKMAKNTAKGARRAAKTAPIS